MDYNNLKNLVTETRDKRKANVEARFQEALNLLQTQKTQQEQQAERSIQEQERLAQSQRASISQDLADAQRSNRIRARAVGGANSSGYLELQNRAEREAQRTAGNIGATTAKNISSIRTNLTNAITGIEGDIRKSQREKDLEISQLEAEALQEILSLDTANAGYNTSNISSGAELPLDLSAFQQPQAQALEASTNDPYDKLMIEIDDGRTPAGKKVGVYTSVLDLLQKTPKQIGTSSLGLSQLRANSILPSLSINNKISNVAKSAPSGLNQQMNQLYNFLKLKK